MAKAPCGAIRSELARPRDPLAVIYRRFKDGFDTPDLIGAKALRDALPS